MDKQLILQKIAEAQKQSLRLSLSQSDLERKQGEVKRELWELEAQLKTQLLEEIKKEH